MRCGNVRRPVRRRKCFRRPCRHGCRGGAPDGGEVAEPSFPQRPFFPERRDVRRRIEALRKPGKAPALRRAPPWVQSRGCAGACVFRRVGAESGRGAEPVPSAVDTKERRSGACAFRSLGTGAERSGGVAFSGSLLFPLRRQVVRAGGCPVCPRPRFPVVGPEHASGPFRQR